MQSTNRFLLGSYLFAFLLSIVAFPVSSSDPIVDLLITKALDLQLSEQLTWQRLLHYHPSKTRAGTLVSHIDDDRFFLSKAGRTDAKQELEATLAKLFTPSAALENNKNPRCHFVEREKWLRDKLGLTQEPVPEFCTDYHQWRANISAHSVTLVFPAAYLNSPSSMFGHTMFRLDPENIEQDSSWLSYALNFSANVGADTENSMGYAIKGITGAYPGKFNLVPYFQKLQEYGAIENRDIWEYNLNLTAAEVGRLMDHSWELRDINFDYYFFRENCSFRLLELLDYARPSQNLADQFTYTAIPADTVKSVVDAGLVADVQYRPSVGTELQYNVAQIPKKLRHWVSKLENDPELATSDEFLAIDKRYQLPIVQAANQLLTYRSRKAGITRKNAGKRFRMLQLISQFPTHQAALPPVPVRPDTGHDTVMVSLGVGRERKLDYTEASLRLSYHDLLDRSDGYLRGAGISLGNLTVRRFEDGEARLNSFDIIRLRSVGSRFSMFRSISWGVDVGFVRDPLLEDERMSFRLKAHAGKSRMVSENATMYALASPSINIFGSGDNRTYINAHAAVGLLNYNRLGTAQIELGADSLQRQPLRLQLALRQNFSIARNHAIRIELSSSRLDETTVNAASLSYRVFF
ncbi:MAG: DUF4105 domain-containing protein [Granulosicoccus sp.]